MIYYFLPQPTIHGGIKVGFRFAEILRELGLDVVMVTPNGSAPSWFASDVPVLRRERILPKLSPQDRVIFSLPFDYDDLKGSGAKLVFHCQGTDEAITPILEDRTVEILTCWNQAEGFAASHGRVSKNVGISISRDFFYSGQTKEPGSYAFMPRRGFLLHQESLDGFQPRPLDKAKEAEVAQALKSSSGFLALAEDEWFGLPALEAMAAGCLVVSPRTVGGGEYLLSDQNCLIESVENLAERMSYVLNNEQKFERFRYAAQTTAYRYHPRAQLHHVKSMLAEGGLSCLV